MSTRKFAFIASLLSVVGLLAGSAPAATKYTTMTDLKGGSDDSHSSETSWGNVFGNGGGISNGTLTVKFAKDKWGTFDGLSVIVGQKGVLTANCASSGNKNGQLNIKGGATMTLDGGTFVNNNDRTKTYGNMIATDGSDGTMRIINGGVFKSPNIHVELGAKQGSTGTLSVDNGTVEVGGATGSKWLTVGGTRGEEAAATYGGTGILAMTNATLIAESVVLGSAYKYANTADGDNKYTAKVTFKDTKITTQRFYSLNKVKADSFVIFDGATVNTAANSKDLLAALAVDYTLEGSGVTINTKHSGTTVGGAFVGNGPFIKKGAETLTFKGKFTDSADLRVEEGVFAIDSTAMLPTADKIDLAISGTGAFLGLDQTATYKSLTLGEGAAWEVTIDEEGTVSQPWTASSFTIDATAQNPILLTISGTVDEDPIQLPNLKAADRDKIRLLTTGLQLVDAGDGEGLAVQKTPREVGIIHWNGAQEGLWWGKNNWLLDDSETTFVNGDTAVFNKEDAAVTLDRNAVVAGLYVTNNVTIAGEKTLVAPIIDVTAEKTATIAVPLSEDIEKTGEGELVLQDYADGKALDLKEGKVTLAWSDAAKANPFSTEVDANVIAGVLDLGGATQRVSSHALAGNGNGILRDGGVLLNGKLEIDPNDSSANNWWRLQDTTFTVGAGATLEILKTTNQDGELGFMNGARLIIDGGRVNALNGRGGGAGAYLGCDKPGVNTIRIQNGGTFYQPNQFLRVGYNGGGTGILSVDGGTVDLGEQELRIACEANTTGIFAMTNGTLIASDVYLCEGGSCPATFVLSTNSTAKIGQIKKNNTPVDGSSVVFDGATLVPTAAGSFLPDLGIPVTIGANGLVISNDFNVTVAAPLAGEGKLTKKGAGMLTFSGAQSFEGGLEVCAGSICSTLTADGFATQNFDLSLNLADGETVRLTIAGTPEPGENYTLFKSGITEDTLSRLTIDANCELSLEDGQLKVKLMPLSLTWTGDGNDKLWSTVANWRDALRGPAKFDTVIFDGESDETEYDLANGLLLKEIDVNSGAWTTKVDTACFAGVPVQVKSGALFALTGAKGKTNPFSTANAANSIAGVLDLGGATQTFAGALADGNGIFRDGGEIRNVALTIDPAGWFRLHNVSFTIGQGAKVTVNKYENSNGQINFYNTHLVIDGGELNALNARNASNVGAYIGNNGDATIEILNGGKFSHPNKPVILGYGKDGKCAGYLIGDHATVDLGGQKLHLGSYEKSDSYLALTNSTLSCDSITLGFDGTPGKQTVELVNTTATISSFDAKKIGSSVSITFDNATIVHSGTNVQLLPDLNEGKIPYTIAAGGLTIKVENIKDDKTSLTLPGVFAGEGGITLVATGKTPKSVGFTGTAAEKGFTGTLVVSNKITVVAVDKTFKGGLYACEGSTLDVATSVFEGDVTIEEGVKFVGLDAEQDYENPVTLLQTKGTITSPLLEGKNPNTKNRYFVRSRLGVNVLCYGRKQGTMITIR